MAFLTLAYRPRRGNETPSTVQTASDNCIPKHLKNGRDATNKKRSQMINKGVQEERTITVSERGRTHKINEERVILKNLPAEILELITWYSLNPAMIIVSKSINHKLSNIKALQIDMVNVLFSRWSARSSDYRGAPAKTSVAQSHPISKQSDSDLLVLQKHLVENPYIQFSHLQRSASLVYTAWLRRNWTVEGTSLQSRSLIQAILNERVDILSVFGRTVSSKDGHHQLSLTPRGVIRITCEAAQCMNPKCKMQRSSGQLFGFRFVPLRVLRLANGEKKRRYLAFIFMTSLCRGDGELLLAVESYDILADAIADAAQEKDTLTVGILLALLETNMTNTWRGRMLRSIKSDWSQLKLEMTLEAMRGDHRQLVCVLCDNTLGEDISSDVILLRKPYLKQLRDMYRDKDARYILRGTSRWVIYPAFHRATKCVGNDPEYRKGLASLSDQKYEEFDVQGWMSELTHEFLRFWET